jgi:purine-nucleoside phosphorylase
MDIETEISFSDIPYFPVSTIAGHEGRLLVGTLGGRRVILLSGRAHYYEGYSARRVTFAVRLLRQLGVKTLIITNSSGGLNPLFSEGTLMVIKDHLNFLGDNPLRGPNVDSWGVRFPDLSEPYDPSLAKCALNSSARCGIPNVVTGTYVCVAGPSLETAAETRWLLESGADAVGMSTVPEVIVARHGGMKVLGISIIVNSCTPESQQPVLLEGVLDAASRAVPELQRLLVDILATMDNMN